MKESEIRAKAIRELEGEGWVCWWPPRSNRFTKNKDIFNCFDLICAKGKKTRFIQLTTLGHISDRRKKIKASGIELKGEIWGYSKAKKVFKKIAV